jgi:hypothetical protein
MNESQVRRNVVAILDHNGLPHSDDDNGYAVRFSSALLRVGFSSIGTQVVITLGATVLRGVQVADRIGLLNRLNDLNQETHFGKWVFYDDETAIAVEYDLLGDHLQEDELMTAIAALARVADREDDLLKDVFGGLRAFEQD